MHILSVENVTKQFGDTYAVKDVSFHVPKGVVYGIIGPNGAGKTTTIRMIMNIYMPDSGKVSLFEQPMSDDLKYKIGYLPEERGLYPKMKVVDMMTFLGELHGLKKNIARKKSLEWLERLELQDRSDSRVDELSKGMQQKLQIIGTLLHDPELIILDEPFSGLDPVNINLVKNTIIELRNAGRAIMLSTHIMESAEKMCDEILMISHGEKVLDGNLNEILTAHGKKSVHIEFNGNAGFLADLPEVQKADVFSNYAEVVLVDNMAPADFLRKIINKLEISSFSSMRSSLNEIFISLAGGTHEHE